MTAIKNITIVLLFSSLRFFAQQDLPLNGHYVSYRDSAKTKKSVEGAFSKGEKIGEWTEWNYDGVVISRGKFVKGKREGEWMFKSAPYSLPGNYTMETGRFKKGKRDGVWSAYDSAGKQIEKQEYVNKRNSSYFKIRYINGQKKAEGAYVYIKENEKHDGWDDKRGNGHKNGIWVEWYENGQKKSEMKYVNGQKDGKDIKWHENGKMKSSEEYINGKQNGLGTHWAENGQMLSEIEYKDGIYNGKYINYDNGKKNLEMLYKDGKLLRSVRYKENGEVESVHDYEK